MSGREIELPPGAEPVQVVAGVADVFVLARSGGGVPLGTVGAGAVIVPGAQAAALRVVPRIDGEVAPAGPDRADAGPDGPDAGPDGIAAFVETVARRVGGDSAQVLLSASAAELPGALDTALTAYVDADDEARRRRREDGEARDGQLLAAAYRRARADIEGPGRAPRVESPEPLVAVFQILGRAQGFAVVEPTRAGDGRAPRLAALAHASGVRVRPVRLRPGWDRERARPYLGWVRPGDGGGLRPVALLPFSRGYRIQEAGDLRPRRLTPEVARTLAPAAHQIYPPLPRQRAVTTGDVARLAGRGSAGDWLWAAGLALAVTILGLLTPVLTNAVVDTIIPEGRRDLLAAAGAALVVAALVAGVFSFVQYVAMSRFALRATERVQPAFWDRVLAMPPAFFRRFSAGDLAVRVMAVDALAQLVNVQVVGASLAALFSLVNVGLMFHYSVALGVAGTAVLVVTVVVLAITVRATGRLYTVSVDAQLRGSSWVVQVLTAIPKVRLANAETRLQSRYLDLVREQVVAMAGMTRVLGRAQGWIAAATVAAPAAFFVVIGRGWDARAPVDTATYLAFTTAFLAAFGAVSGLSAAVTPLASAGPVFGLLDLLMTSLPEAATHRADPGPLRGEIELRSVTFRYGADGPTVLDRLSLHVRPGELVALVGPSGSGKSTTVRVVLGFDEPEAGQVLIDGRDLRDLDLDLVRAQMGVVVQNGQISHGSILHNILGGAAGDEGDAWAAATEAALADDIRAMPMKMQTLVDPQVLSGGQAQKILLARALVRRPAIVVLDEATSALDNASQAAVTGSLDRLAVTRIVVAHRLSTIRAADRIVVLVAGRVVEEGGYDDLLARGGVFTDLVARQLA